MSQDYIPLATVTLGTATASVTFSNIPASPYRDLILIQNLGTSTSPDDVLCRLNGDTGSNYTWVRMLASDSGTVSSTGVYQALPVQFSGVVSGGMAVFQLFDYSATDKHKTALSRAGGPNYNIVEAVASRWANTAAVTSMTLIVDTGSLAAGSTFSLYGIVA
jgi:hypothetical protein